MGLVAGITRQAARVIGRDDLRERLRLCRVRFVAAHAQHRRIELGGSHRGWIVSVLGLRSVTSLAIYMRMLAVFLFVEYVCMATFAGVMAGIINGPRRNFGERIPAVMSIFAETLRDQKTANH